jgi:hypothetical protein
MKLWFSSLLVDSFNGSVSSRRVVTFIAFILCAIDFWVELFNGRRVSDHTLDSMMYIVIAGLGFTASDKLTTMFGNTPPQPFSATNTTPAPVANNTPVTPVVTTQQPVANVTHTPIVTSQTSTPLPQYNSFPK